MAEGVASAFIIMLIMLGLGRVKNAKTECKTKAWKMNGPNCRGISDCLFCDMYLIL